MRVSCYKSVPEFECPYVYVTNKMLVLSSETGICLDLS